MKARRHHNNKGLRQIKRGKTEKQVKRMAKKLGMPYAKSQKEIPGELEYFQGELCTVKNPSRQGGWRFHEHVDQDGYCNNPARGY